MYKTIQSWPALVRVAIGTLLGLAIGFTFVLMLNGWHVFKNYNWSKQWNHKCVTYYCP
jgi:hypothetical protein